MRRANTVGKKTVNGGGEGERVGSDVILPGRSGLVVDRAKISFRQLQRRGDEPNQMFFFLDVDVWQRRVQVGGAFRSHGRGLV